MSVATAPRADANRRIQFAMVCAWMGKLAGVLGNLLVMPLLFRRLDKETLGLWFTLAGTNTMLTLMGLGVTPSLTRQIALIVGKQQTGDYTPEDDARLGALIATGRRLLQILSLVNLMAIFAFGFSLLNGVALAHLPFHTVALAWALFCAGFAINTWYSYLDACLAGSGQVGWDSLIGSGMLILTAAGTVGVVLAGGGLVGLAAVPLAVGIVNRFLLYRVMRWKLPHLLTLPGRYSRAEALTLVRPAMTLWAGSIGAFLILRTDNYFIATLRGVREIPAYQVAYSLVFNLFQIAISRSASSVVFISQAWRPDAPQAVHALVIGGARFAAVVMAAGTAFLLVNGQALTNVWLGPGNFVGWPVLTVMCVMINLEAQHCSLVYAAWSGGDDVYAPWSLGAGVLNLVLTYLLIRPYGLLGVALGTMLTQLFTNNWYCALRPCRYLRLPVRRYVGKVWTAWGVCFAACGGLEWIAARGLGFAGPLALLAVNAFVSASIVGIMLRHELAGPAGRVLRRLGLGPWFNLPADLPS